MIKTTTRTAFEKQLCENLCGGQNVGDRVQTQLTPACCVIETEGENVLVLSAFLTG